MDVGEGTHLRVVSALKHVARNALVLLEDGVACGATGLEAHLAQLCVTLSVAGSPWELNSCGEGP